MKRNIWFILLTIIVAILGVLIFQIYWISNTYDVHSRSFTQEVDLALEEVLSVDITSKTLHQILKTRVRQKDSVHIQSSETGEWTWEIQEFYQEESWLIEGDKGEFNLPPDDFLEVFGNVVMSTLASEPDISDLSKKYTDELTKRGIESEFELAYMRDEKILKASVADTGVFINAQARQKIPGRNQDELILAWFPKTNSYILKNMWLTLLGSLLLFSLIAGSFWLMLKTILSQKRVSEVKNDFINNMTHEFKTPISTVSAAMEALVSFDGLSDKERSRRYVEISRNEMSRLAGLVDKVLSISMFEQKKIVLNKETFNVTTLLQELSQQYAVKGDGRVHIQMGQENAAYLFADKFHLQNVLTNLLDNAVKYSGEEVVINIGCWREGDFIIINVKDNGIGISKEHQKHIFEKFYRVPTGDLHGVKGFGLGLNYVKEIVEMHGGTVGLKSQPGIGSEFIIAIPDIHD